MSEASAEPDSPPVLEHFQDRDDGDLTIKCPDGGEFHVYRIILSKASPVFKDMLSLPAARPNASGDGPSDHVVEVTEDSKTFQRLLQFCYPQDDPVMASLPIIHRVLKACDKYQMDAMGRKTEKQLRTFITEEPLRVFCIACDTRLVDVARDAAFECLRKPRDYLVETDTPELSMLNAAVFVQLLRYYKTCMTVSTSFISIRSPYCMDWIVNPNSCWFVCRKCDPIHLYAHTYMSIKNGSIKVHPRKWWGDVMGSIAFKLGFEGVPLNLDNATEPLPAPPADIKGCEKCSAAFYTDMLRLVKDMKPALESALRKVSIAFLSSAVS